MSTPTYDETQTMLRAPFRRAVVAKRMLAMGTELLPGDEVQAKPYHNDPEGYVSIRFRDSSGQLHEFTETDDRIAYLSDDESETLLGCGAEFMSTGVTCRLYADHKGRHRGWSDTVPDSDTVWATGPAKVTEHKLLVPMFITGDKFQALDIGRSDFICGNGGPEVSPAIRDTRVMALPDDERERMGLWGGYWLVTVETWGRS